MRIISGTYKNRRIEFKNLKIRPTTDFAKESLFNILNNYYDLKKISVLDLFAGSGNISYEFISRGCPEIIAIEKNTKCFNFIKKTKLKLNMNNLTIILSEVNTYLKKIKKSYDIIFLDPPYNYEQSQYDQILENIFLKKLLSDCGMIIIEHSKFINFEHYPSFLNKRKYGRVNFSFLKNE